MRIAVVLAAFMAAAPVLAQTAPPPAVPAKPAVEPAKAAHDPKDDMICEEDASSTGSILHHRICKTRGQRESQTSHAAEALRKIARQPGGMQLGSGP